MKNAIPRGAGPEILQRCFFQFNIVNLNDVVDVEVGKVVELDSAFESLLDFADVIVEAAERADFTVEDEFAAAEHARFRADFDHAFFDDASADFRTFGKFENLEDFRHAEFAFALLRRKASGQSVAFNVLYPYPVPPPAEGLISV